jgi:transposase
MSQPHKRLTDDQGRAFFHSCCQGALSQTEIQKVLEISKTRFFALLKVFREGLQNLTIAYNRRTPAKLSSQAESKIKKLYRKRKSL